MKKITAVEFVIEITEYEGDMVLDRKAEKKVLFEAKIPPEVLIFLRAKIGIEDVAGKTTEPGPDAEA